MDSLTFDGYTSSDSSAPRTPSPHDAHMHFNPHFKQNFDDSVPNVFSEDDNPAYWDSTPAAPFNDSRPSLLQELYDHDIQDHHHLSPEFPSHEPQFASGDNWNQIGRNDFHIQRRATFPSVRHDRGDGMYPPFVHQHQQQHHSSLLHSFNSRQEIYPEHADNSLTGKPFLSSPHSSYHEFDESNIKLEDAPHLVPSQPFYRSPSSSSGHPMTMTYLSPHTGLPVQHTDDAASKETQYLRRRCFNCHTTEPPSWRRSTLNPGKIVCNKCGLYERTHLRPRPLRFDELRAGNKARKQSKRTLSPKARANGGSAVKKEPREYDLVRRSSQSSLSSVHSGSGASDWDDNVSGYSGSAPPTSFNSPNVSTFPLSRDTSSSPPQVGIRLPNAPLSDIASMQLPQQQQSAPQTPNLPPPSPRKAHTSPSAYFSPPSTVESLQQQDYFRRTSVVQESPISQLLASPHPTPVAS